MPNLYCIPYKRKIKKHENGIVYHCEKEGSEDESMNSSSIASYSPSSSSSSSPELNAICNACQKGFKNARCLKIHKTKMHHWGASFNDPVNGPRRRKPKKADEAPKQRAKPVKKKRKRSNDGSPRNSKK
jgi:hypothetical protein